MHLYVWQDEVINLMILIFAIRSPVVHHPVLLWATKNGRVPWGEFQASLARRCKEKSRLD